MKFFSNRWSRTPIGRHSPHSADYLPRSISSASSLVKMSRRLVVTHFSISPATASSVFFCATLRPVLIVNLQQLTQLSSAMEHRDSVFRHARERLPVRSRPQALQNVDLVGVRADQDARFAALDAPQNPRCGHFRRSPE